MRTREARTVLLIKMLYFERNRKRKVRNSPTESPKSHYPLFLSPNVTNLIESRNKWPSLPVSLSKSLSLKGTKKGKTAESVQNTYKILCTKAKAAQSALSNKQLSTLFW